MRKIKKVASLLLAASVLAGMLFLPGCSAKEQIVIYTSAEHYRLDDLSIRLAEAFPQYDCLLEYKDTGSHAASLLAEGKDTVCDITYDLEYGYLEQLAAAGYLADLSAYDRSIYTEDAAVSSFYLPVYRNGGAIIVNPAVLQKHGLSAPASYEDLLEPQYKGLISMPSPKSSGTGYMFVKAMVNTMGETAAFDYFQKLDANILAYTSSGSGPVNALKNQEAAIGLGMTAQAVIAINDGVDLDILYFDGGSPYCMYGQGIISGKETRSSVQEVFDFLIHTYTKENNQRFTPEQIYKDYMPEVKNYPTNIVYADMSGNTNTEKSRLLDKWPF